MTPPPSPETTSGGPPADAPDSPDAPDNAATGSTAAGSTAPDSATSSTADEGEPGATKPIWAKPDDPTAEEPDDGAATETVVVDEQVTDGEEDGEDIALEEAEPATGDIPDEVLVTGNASDTLIPLVGTILALVAVAALLMIGFVLPASKSGPKDVPIGAAGTTEITGKVKDYFNQTFPGQYEVTAYADGAALQKAIDNRSVYGGLVVTEQAFTMLVAQAASEDMAQRLASVGTQLQAQVADAKPTPAKDPRGVALMASGIPLAIAGIFSALILIWRFRTRPLAQFGAEIATAFAIALAAAAMMTFWLGATDGANFWLVTVALFAGLLSAGLVLIGLHAVGGRIAAGIGVAVLVLVSIPLSGLSSAPELLPQPWGDIGQFLPAGAAATLLRNAAFFDAHAVGKPLAVLGVWALAGMLMLLLSETLSDSMIRTGPPEELEEFEAKQELS